MKSKAEYTKPLIEIVEVTVEGVIATSNYSLNEETTYNGAAFSNKRSFWGEE